MRAFQVRQRKSVMEQRRTMLTESKPTSRTPSVSQSFSCFYVPTVPLHTIYYVSSKKAQSQNLL